MKKENAFMVLFVLLITILIVLLCVAPVFAQDEMPPEEEPVEEPIDEPVDEEPFDPFSDWTYTDCVGNCDEPIELVVEGCVKYPLAMNWLGPQSDWEGWTMVDDGSCFCMDYNDEIGAYEVPCETSNGSFHQMLIDEGIIEKMPWMPDIIHPKFVEPESEIIADYVEGAEDTILVGDYDFGEPLSMEWVE